jgi:cell division protein FtsI/penicillin-binding protein 2
MAKRLQFQRLSWLAALLALSFAGLGYRLVDLQLVQHDTLTQKADGNTHREFLIEPRRGDICDIQGNILATTMLVKRICADPSLLGNRTTEVARALSPFLELSEVALCNKLRSTAFLSEDGRVVTNKYVKLKSKVPVEIWEKIRVAMASLPLDVDETKLPKTERAKYVALRQEAIFAEDDQLRSYPNGTLAAQVLGIVSSQERELPNHHFVSEMIGREGIEGSLNKNLSGVRGFRQTEIDSHKRELITLREQDVEPCDGLNVVLTIDSVVQNIVEAALATAKSNLSPVSISGLAIRPRTGEILAMATLPTFDPNNSGSADPETRRNRVICDVAEPGSTFKIVVVSGALNDGTVRLSDVFDCEHGRFYYAGKPLRDHEPYGDLTTERIITKSSNIGAAKIGIKMGEKRLADYIHAFGFGTRTLIPLPAEASGLGTQITNWTKISIAQIPMGQGVAVTRLQMTMAMGAIANHGLLMRPMLVDRFEDRDHKALARFSPQRVRQVISEATALQMVQALKTVATSEGTAPKAALEHYTVAGKTGTAQKAGIGGYQPGKYYSSFIGFFPADNPELCISVMLDEPDVHKGYYGGQTAAPVFKEIAEKAATYLNIHPDKALDSVTPDSAVGPVNNRSPKTAAAWPPVKE